MPSENEHLNKARNNRALAYALNPATGPNTCGWAITILFYSALHYVEAYHAKLNPPQHYQNHNELKRVIVSNANLRAIADDYEDLFQFSWNARYGTAQYGEVQINEAKQLQTTVQGHIDSLLSK
jgi:hypothetical protein